jgi:hypothetical protein
MGNAIKLPKKIDIFGIPYKVIYTKTRLEADADKRQQLDGQIDYINYTIRIYDAGQSKEDVFNTLIHEIIHGVLWHYGISEFFDESRNELITNLTASGICDTLIRNKLISLK